jgi:hypothetical protein
MPEPAVPIAGDRDSRLCLGFVVVYRKPLRRRLVRFSLMPTKRVIVDGEQASRPERVAKAGRIH